MCFYRLFLCDCAKNLSITIYNNVIIIYNIKNYRFTPTAPSFNSIAIIESFDHYLPQRMPINTENFMENEGYRTQLPYNPDFNEIYKTMSKKNFE